MNRLKGSLISKVAGFDDMSAIETLMLIKPFK
jgi:hypothetical protein